MNGFPNSSDGNEWRKLPKSRHTYPGLRSTTDRSPVSGVMKSYHERKIKYAVEWHDEHGGGVTIYDSFGRAHGKALEIERNGGEAKVSRMNWRSW